MPPPSQNPGAVMGTIGLVVVLGLAYGLGVSMFVAVTEFFGRVFQGVAGGGGGAVTASEAPVIPESTLPEHAFYGYHGTSNKAARRIVGWGLLPADLHPSTTGMMGAGVYCTTDIEKAQRFGPYILTIKFFPQKYRTRGITIGCHPDTRGSWRPNGFAGVYVPAGTAAHRDEFCIDISCIAAVRRTIDRDHAKVARTAAVCRKVPVPRFTLSPAVAALSGGGGVVGTVTAVIGICALLCIAALVVGFVVRLMIYLIPVAIVVGVVAYLTSRE
eukprot:NODE_48_length_2247_cov_394.919017_g41_i0.p2 GENE.NODE_48_length_2247_cov_394.919017_g41_i0~~NODE_48_length_2247_cov_394.919017_g41_i0.p2  ORF type:complete len:272 (+),score=66.44 NODE_48_length_2247_cov_394.919017_g41_i0:112-927(+)